MIKPLRIVLILALLCTFNAADIFAQMSPFTCPIIAKRNNGNGSPQSGAGKFINETGSPEPVLAAPNVRGGTVGSTTYPATSYNNVAYKYANKTGNMTINWISNTFAGMPLPIISRVWLTASGTTSLMAVKFGPPKAAYLSGGKWYTDYHYYFQNFPPQGKITVEWVDPQTSSVIQYNTYDLQTGACDPLSAPGGCFSNPTITTQPANLSVCGTGTATFSVIATGASTYQWQVSTNNGSSWTNITNGSDYSGATTATLSIANRTSNNGNQYRVIVTGSQAGCSTTSSAATLNARPNPTAVFATTSYCGVGTRNLQVNLTGTAPWSITYTTNGGSPVTVTDIASSPHFIEVTTATTSTYQLTNVSDAYCSATPSGNVSTTIGVVPSITLSSATLYACFGSSTFNLDYSSTGGTPNTYSITSGSRAMPVFTTVTDAALGSSPLSITIPNTAAVGTYDFKLTVKNASGCTSAIVPFTVTIRSLPTVGASAGTTSSICSGGTANLTATPSGLTAYSWNIGAGSVLATTQTYSPTVNATTTYTVTGTDANGCSNTANVTVTILGGSGLTLTSNPTICSGNAAILEASGAESYTWSPNTNLSSTVGDAVIAAPTTTTTYTVTGTNSNGCISTADVTVTVNSVSITVTPSATICSGSTNTLTASGGTTYIWYPTTGLFTDASATIAYTGTNISTVYAKPSSTTTYYVVGTSAAGCSATASSTITIANAPIVSGSSTGNTLIFCTQGTSTFDLSVATNTALSSTTWSYSTNGTTYTNLTAGLLTSVTGTDLQTSTSGSSPNITYTTRLSNYGSAGYSGPRYFRLAMTDASCTYNYNIFITDTKKTNPTPAPTSTQSTICSGNSTVVTIGSLASGSTVQWQTSPNNSTWTDSSGAISASITVSPTGNRYYRAVFNGGSGNCGATSTSTLITVVSGLEANTLTPSTTCTNGSGSYTITGSAITSGSYQWQSSTTSSSSGFSDVLGATSKDYTLPVNIVSQTTWYRRIATNGTCPSNTSAAVAVYAPITNNSVTNSTTSFCETATATALTVTTPAGGDGSYTYQWQSSTTSSSTGFSNIGGATSSTYTTVSQTQNYWYRRVVSSGGCADNSNSFKITVNPKPTITVTASSTVCANTAVTLTASGGNSYSWTPATDLSATSGGTVISTPSTNRTYTVTGTDVNGCTNTANTTITATVVPSTPTLSSSSQTICNNGSAVTLSSLVTSGGTTEWYSVPEVNASFLVTSANTTGTYYCFAKSGSCYSNAASFTLTVVDVSTPVVSETTFTACSPASFDLTNLEPEPANGVTLEWHTVSSSPNAGTKLNTAAAQAINSSGTYYLYAYSSAGTCYSSSGDQVIITINTTPATPTLTAAAESICTPNTIDLTNNYTPVVGVTYNWYKNTESAGNAVLAPSAVSESASYLLVASKDGCTSDPATITVNFNTTPAITLSSEDDFCGVYTGKITATVTDASSPTYAWYYSIDRGSSWTEITAGNAGSTYADYTTAILDVSNLTTASDGTYIKCVVTNSNTCSVTSDAAILLSQPSAAVTCPSNGSVVVGSNYTFTATTSGVVNSIKWQVSSNGTDFTDLTETAPYSGTTETSLLITGATSDMNGKYYRAVVGNSCPGETNCTSAARLTVNGPLPVTWLSFTGKPAGKQVILDWSTATETNSRDFRIFHSSDGNQWSEIGVVGAAGNSQTTQHYRFIHTSPSSGFNAYYILQRDLDGQTVRSRIVNVIMNNESIGLIVYPNPVIDNTIRIQLSKPATILFYNSAGSIVYRRLVSSGSHTLILPSLAAGIYRVQAGDESVPIMIHR